MVFGIVFIIVFIIGFSFGLGMPFILNHLGIYKKTIKDNTSEPSTNVKEIMDEWMNGIRGE